MQKRRKSDGEAFNVWRSYSDMMAGVLLLFVLLMCVTLFQAQVSYDESIKERDEKIALQEEYTAELLSKQMALDEQSEQLKVQDEQIRDQAEELTKQQVLLAELANQLKEKEEQLNAQALVLSNQEEQLTLAQEDIDEKTRLLAVQQKRIDNIIGVKSEVVESLQKEFASQNVAVNIDSATGALTLDANIMFGVGESELTPEGEHTLYEVLPIYCKVLLSEEYIPYLGEIIIDGYTDDDGSDDYNLELSQQRSLAVAEYLLGISEDLLTAQENVDLMDYLTVNGHSMSNLVYYPNGTVNKDASRRVEVKFRLKDDEMIQELRTIMSQAQE